MDHFRKMFLAGIGALSLSKERAQKVTKELIAQGRLREKEGRKLAAEMLKKAADTRQDLERTVNSQVAAALKNIHWATQEQLQKLEQRIRGLEQALARKNKAAANRPKTAKPPRPRRPKNQGA